MSAPAAALDMSAAQPAVRARVSIDATDGVGNKTIERNLGCGIFFNVLDLITSIETYLERHNETPIRYAWTATAENIRGKVSRARAALDKRSRTASHLPTRRCQCGPHGNHFAETRKRPRTKGVLIGETRV